MMVERASLEEEFWKVIFVHIWFGTRRTTLPTISMLRMMPMMMLSGSTTHWGLVGWFDIGFGVILPKDSAECQLLMIILTTLMVVMTMKKMMTNKAMEALMKMKKLKRLSLASSSLLSLNIYSSYRFCKMIIFIPIMAPSSALSTLSMPHSSSILLNIQGHGCCIMIAIFLVLLMSTMFPIIHRENLNL